MCAEPTLHLRIGLRSKKKETYTPCLQSAFATRTMRRKVYFAQKPFPINFILYVPIGDVKCQQQILTDAVDCKYFQHTDEIFNSTIDIIKTLNKEAQNLNNGCR
jgi:hypothetical protein